jgi:transposase-like protein
MLFGEGIGDIGVKRPNKDVSQEDKMFVVMDAMRYYDHSARRMRPGTLNELSVRHDVSVSSVKRWVRLYLAEGEAAEFRNNRVGRVGRQSHFTDDVRLNLTFINNEAHGRISYRAIQAEYLRLFQVNLSLSRIYSYFNIMGAE